MHVLILKYMFVLYLCRREGTIGFTCVGGPPFALLLHQQHRRSLCVIDGVLHQQLGFPHLEKAKQGRWGLAVHRNAPQGSQVSAGLGA